MDAKLCPFGTKIYVFPMLYSGIAAQFKAIVNCIVTLSNNTGM